MLRVGADLEVWVLLLEVSDGLLLEIGRELPRAGATPKDLLEADDRDCAVFELGD